ncbi:MAG TPA: efflux RND transporter periplasmic adaptor subunit [Gemmataceae bacterium]|jgi:membrane fusion protein (multidrug efflux system)
MTPILRLLRAATGSDRDLLDRYVSNRDEEAFEALVQRYGTGVWATCVRLAGRDAEDAFQAVFLLLSRKAGKVTGSLPAWLHAVTRRVASTIRRTDRRRSAIEAAAARPDRASSSDSGLREGLDLLDEELSRLPERYRAVLIVCCLEGRSRDEAAAQLQWTEGQVKGRLERAREMLRVRLARRGVELGGLLLAAAITGPVPVRAIPASQAALTLTQGVIRTMLIQKLRLATVLLAACAGAVFAGGMALRAQPGDDSTLPKAAAIDPRTDNDDAAGRRRFKETTRNELESLSKRVDALERKLPTPERQKIVVTSPLAKDIAATQRYVGRIHAHRHINISALSSGVISEVAIKEGQAVKKGDLLFKVLPTLSQAKLDAEMAEVKIAQLEFNNAKELFKNKVVSHLEVALHEAKLAKAQAKAKLAAAELKLTAVQAPFDGLVGRVQLQEGSAVKDGSVLTTLSDNSAVWVYFNVPESRYLEYMANPESRKDGTPIELVLANGSKFPQTGKLGAIEGQFDNGTGTIPFRADFPNPKGLLRHGQTGTVLIREPLKPAIVIPQRATFEERDKRYVYTVGKDGMVHRREIVVLGETAGLFVVKKGLDASDRIVVDGVRQVRDGEKLAGYDYRKPEEVIGGANKPDQK